MDFLKMHGLGNDFIVLDARQHGLDMGPERARLLADRKRGIGCDQIMLLKKSDEADIFLEMWNADGDTVGACGNGTRCVAALMLDETGADTVSIQTEAGILSAWSEAGEIAVNMGPARLGWSDIPLATEMDTAAITLDGFDLPPAIGVSMGNPHMVFFIDDAEAIDVASLGPQIETHALFPERTNVEFVHQLGPDHWRMRVWERGVGITEACGSGACAVAVAAARTGRGGRRSVVALDGGSLTLTWREDGDVIMRGPTAISFKGQISDV